MNIQLTKTDKSFSICKSMKTSCDLDDDLLRMLQQAGLPLESLNGPHCRVWKTKGWFDHVIECVTPDKIVQIKYKPQKGLGTFSITTCADLNDVKIKTSDYQNFVIEFFRQGSPRVVALQLEFNCAPGGTDFSSDIRLMMEFVSAIFKAMPPDSLVTKKKDLVKILWEELPTTSEYRSLIKDLQSADTYSMFNWFRQGRKKAVERFFQFAVYYDEDIRQGSDYFRLLFKTKLECFLLDQMWMSGALMEALHEAEIDEHDQELEQEIELTIGARNFLHRCMAAIADDYESPEELKTRALIAQSALCNCSRLLAGGHDTSVNRGDVLQGNAGDWNRLLDYAVSTASESSRMECLRPAALVREFLAYVRTPSSEIQDYAAPEGCSVLGSDGIFTIAWLASLKSGLSASDPKGLVSDMAQAVIKMLTMEYGTEGACLLRQWEKDEDKTVKRNASLLLLGTYVSQCSWDAAVPCANALIDIEPHPMAFVVLAIALMRQQTSGNRIAEKLRSVPWWVVFDNIKEPVAAMIDSFSNLDKVEQSRYLINKALEISPGYKMAEDVLKEMG